MKQFFAITLLLVFGICLDAAAQSFTLQGRVTDQNMAPVELHMIGENISALDSI